MFASTTQSYKLVELARVENWCSKSSSGGDGSLCKKEGFLDLGSIETSATPVALTTCLYTSAKILVVFQGYRSGLGLSRSGLPRPIMFIYSDFAARLIN